MMRVVDFGSQSPLRSQTLWHAIPTGVSNGEPPTLSFVRPAAAYVSIGYHTGLDEVDTELPVIRRMIGGGPVYLDRHQLFFQICVPAALPPGAAAMQRLLSPAVAAFRDLGIQAHWDGDISVGGAKVCGVGGGQIGGAALAVGNLIERFDHDAAAEVLRFDDEPTRQRALNLMRAYVRPTPVDAESFKDALVRRYAEALNLRPSPGELSGAEWKRVAELDALFSDPEWLRGPDRPAPPVRSVKIRDGVWVRWRAS